MGTITPFRRPEPPPPEEQPHAQGKATCTHCRHTWQAVAPVGASSLECPSCHLMRGAWTYNFSRGEQNFECKCGCETFRIAPQIGPYCLGCGAQALGWF